jgi:hypothetical protein
MSAPTISTIMDPEPFDQYIDYPPGSSEPSDNKIMEFTKGYQVRNLQHPSTELVAMVKQIVHDEKYKGTKSKQLLAIPKKGKDICYELLITGADVSYPKL